MELLGDRIDLCLIFLETVSFPNWYHLILPSVVYESSSFSTAIPTVDIISFFLILMQVVVVFHYGFNNNGGASLVGQW